MSRIPGVLLDHSIIGQSQLTNFELRKERNLAACRLCGAVFQPAYYIKHPLNLPLDPEKAYEAEREILDWRSKHNSKHSPHEHMLLAMSGRVFTPEAAHKLAPFGLVPVSYQEENPEEVADALLKAPRAPTSSPETTLTHPKSPKPH